MSRVLLACLLSLVALGALSEEQFQEGKHYQLLATPMTLQNPAKSEVVELFWYGCPHCFHFEPSLAEWLETKPDDVVFRRVPAVFAENWIPHARAFYAAEALGVLDKFHSPLFRALHEQEQKIFDEAALSRFAAGNGINPEEFKSAFTGFAIDGKVKQAMLYTRDAGITGVPAVIVNGKYRTSVQLAGGQDETLKVVDFLVAKDKAQ